MKYKLDGINAQRDEIEEKMCEHESIAIETVKNETHIRKKKAENINRAYGAPENFKCKMYMQFTVIKEKSQKKLFEEIMANISSISNNKYRPIYIQISTNPMHKNHEKDYIKAYALYQSDCLRPVVKSKAKKPDKKGT